MQIARVIGTVVATVKNESLEGRKFLIVQTLDADLKGGETGADVAAFDERTGAGQLADAMFRDALSRARPPIHDEGPPVGDVTQVISGEFAEELLRSMRPGQEATFTAEFVRRWFENRRHRFGATA
jgi:microcompartment protein CcmK/EutM